MKLEKLPEGELDVMKVLWQSDAPMKAGDIAKSLAPKHSWKVPTVHKLLSRLEEKGLVSADRTAYFHRFSPAVSESEYISGESTALLKKSGARLPQMVAALIDSNGVTDEELNELSRLIDERLAQLRKER